MAAGALVGALAGVSRADVLYDTLWITERNAYEDASANVNGGRGVWGRQEDARLADDFVVDATRYPNGVRITTLTSDFTTALGSPPADGVIVRLLADEGGQPGPTIYEVTVAPERVTSTPFDDTVFGESGQRLVVDTSHADLVLAPGVYWLNTQPYDTTPAGDAFWQLRDLDAVIGADTHWMWLYYGEFWRASDDGGYGAGTAAMRIEGVAIPAPGAALALGLILGARRRREPAGEPHTLPRL